MRGIVVFAGSSHGELAELIMARLGMPLGRVGLCKFANEEINVEIGQSVRDMDVYIIQTSCGEVNDYFMELLILVHACKIASAARGIFSLRLVCTLRLVTVVAPCFPYSRHVPAPMGKPLKRSLTEWQAEMMGKLSHASQSINEYRFWTACSGTLVANMVQAAGADHVITVDLHSPQFQGYFNIPVDNLSGSPLMIKYLKDHISDWKDAVIVSPDAGGAKRATEIANAMQLGFALIHRNGTVGCEDDRNSLVLVGDVKERDAIIIDDMADTCFTLMRAAKALREAGARKIYAAIMHGVFSGESVEMMQQSEISEIIVSNTVPQHEHLSSCTKFRVFDIAPILAEAIRRTHNGESISYLFNPSAFE